MKLFGHKKGMELGGLYQFVLMIVLIGLILGVGILLLDSFSTASGVTSTASAAINNTRTALATIASSWLSLIILIVVMAIIITLVIRSFSGMGEGGR